EDAKLQTRLLRRKAHGLKKLAATREARGDFGIGVGTRLYTGSWAVRPDWGTVMRENPDEEGNVVSYDVLMDADPRESTMSVDNVKMDVEHARKEVKSS
ncbi:unnamed protein product, partial [Ectocarpus sp. 12 AP-2014]